MSFLPRFVFLLCLIAFHPAQSDELPSFSVLLDEAALVLKPPAGYRDLAPARNPLLSYERALLSPDGLLEIRYALRPLQRLKIDYEDPHGAIPDPNHLFPLMFESVLERLSAGGRAPSRHYPADEAKARFKADWAAAAAFDVDEEFNSTHRQGLLLALHRNKRSDAYVVFLFDEYAPVKAAINDAMGSLSYADGQEVAAQ